MADIDQRRSMTIGEADAFRAGLRRAAEIAIHADYDTTRDSPAVVIWRAILAEAERT